MYKPIRHLSIRTGLTYKYIGYFDLDWPNRHVMCACAVNGQWLLSVYEVLVAQLSGFGLTRPSAPAHTTCGISLLYTYAIVGEEASRWFQMRSIESVDLVVESTSIAQVVASPVSSPKRCPEGATIDALLSFRVEILRHTVCKNNT